MRTMITTFGAVLKRACLNHPGTDHFLVIASFMCHGRLHAGPSLGRLQAGFEFLFIDSLLWLITS